MSSQINVSVSYVSFDLFLRQYSVDSEVKQNIDDHYRSDTKDKSSRKVSSRILHFFSYRVEVCPSFVCPQGSYSCKSDHSYHSAECRVSTLRYQRQIRRLVSEDETGNDYQGDRDTFCYH